MLLQETLPLVVTRPVGCAAAASVRVPTDASRISRPLVAPASDRRWLLEIEVDVPDIDPERLLAECEGFLVDGVDGGEIGVVAEVETAGAAGHVSALIVVCGWFGRRRLRVEVGAIEAVVPGERRIVVRVVP
jgi:hypothetical protein